MLPDPAVNNTGIDAVSQGYTGNERAGLPALLDDFGLELLAVAAAGWALDPV